MRHLLLLLILFCPIICIGQEIENDISVKTYAVPDTLCKKPADYNVSDSLSAVKGNYFNYDKAKPILYLDRPFSFETIRPPKNISEPGTTIIPLWTNAQFIANGNIAVMPGLMQIDSGSIGVNQRIGNVSLYMGGLANKYGYFSGLHTQYGVSGNIQYSISPKLSFTGFGTYYFGMPPMMANGLPMPPAMIGFYGVSTFGGYMSYQFNETFGVDVGAQAVQQFGTNRYQFEPIVTPTFKIGKVKFGLPVGQILNGIIRSEAERRNKH